MRILSGPWPVKVSAYPVGDIRDVMLKKFIFANKNARVQKLHQSTNFCLSGALFTCLNRAEVYFSKLNSNSRIIYLL